MRILDAGKLVDPLPPYCQPLNFECGPCVGISILQSHGKYLSLDEAIRVAGCTPEQGTNTRGMCALFHSQNLHAVAVQHTCIETVWQALSIKRHSVALNVRAYGGEHWVALIGRSQNAYLFMDPASVTGYSFMRKKDLLDRWPERIAVEVWNGRESSPAILRCEEMPL